jgi:hypothetical protein
VPALTEVEIAMSAVALPRWRCLRLRCAKLSLLPPLVHHGCHIRRGRRREPISVLHAENEAQQRDFATGAELAVDSVRGQGRSRF